MKLLTAALSRLPEFEELLAAMGGGRAPAALAGAAGILLSLALYTLENIRRVRK